MSEPSRWPLPDKEALRIRVPKHIEQALTKHPLAKQIYATSIGYYPSAAQHEMGRIAHDDYILIYCAEGRGYLQTQLYDGPINQGDLFILPPETPHKYSSSEESPWTVFWFHFRGELAQSYYSFLYDTSASPVVNTHDIHTLSGFRESIYVARSSFTLASYVYVNSLLGHLLISTARAVNQVAKPLSGLKVEEAQEYMRQNIDKMISLDDLAKLTRLSKYHFSRRYHALTGMSPLQHFMHIKIEHACSLLEQSSLSISDIAYQLGYDDALYFSRVFKKLMKVSPRSYRKSLIART